MPLIGMRGHQQNTGVGGKRADGIEPECQATRLGIGRGIPYQQVDRAAREKELVRGLVDLLLSVIFSPGIAGWTTCNLTTSIPCVGDSERSNGKPCNARRSDDFPIRASPTRISFASYRSTPGFCNSPR